MAYGDPMILLGLVLAIAAVVAVGAAYEWHTKRHLPHDLREISTDALPSEASIRSGELGRTVGSNVYRNMDGGVGS